MGNFGSSLPLLKFAKFRCVTQLLFSETEVLLGLTIFNDLTLASEVARRLQHPCPKMPWPRLCFAWATEMFMKLHLVKKPTFVISAPKCVHENFHALAVGDDTVTFNDQTCAFQVAWQINPHMRLGEVLVSEAISQHEIFSEALIYAGAEILQLPFVHNSFDSVFVKDNALLVWRQGRPQALLAKLKHHQRQDEQIPRRDELRRLGFGVQDTCPFIFEGGDVVVYDNENLAFMGFGFRTDERAAFYIGQFLNSEIITLELIDPHFYHLDTALTVLNNGFVLAYKGAFTEEAWQKLLSCEKIKNLICVSWDEAIQFGLNLVEVEQTVIMGSKLPRIKKILEAFGKTVIVTTLNQYSLAGGNAACLTTKIHEVGPT